MKFFYIFLALAAVAGECLEGNQILHSKSNNKPYQNDPEAVRFVEKYLRGAEQVLSDAAILHYASDQVTVEGAYVELGTLRGRTTNFIAALNPDQTIYTFDSFMGPPEDWDKGDRVLPKEIFAFPPGEKLPLLLLNVEVFPGWFKDTLPLFVEQKLKDRPIAFLHVDCLLYSSTTTGFGVLGSHIVDGTILLFDEIYNYPNFREHEWKAFQEFLKNFSFEAEYLAYNPFHEQIAVRVHKK